MSPAMTSASASPQVRATPSTRSATAGSLVRSDSKISRKGAPWRGDELEVRADAGDDALLVVGGAGQGVPDGLLEQPAVVVDEREVEVELARKVLVQDGFADPGALGDLVHRGRVVAVLDEGGLGGLEQLRPARRLRQPLAPCGAVRRRRHRSSSMSRHPTYE